MTPDSFGLITELVSVATVHPQVERIDFTVTTRGPTLVNGNEARTCWSRGEQRARNSSFSHFKVAAVGSTEAASVPAKMKMCFTPLFLDNLREPLAKRGLPLARIRTVVFVEVGCQDFADFKMRLAVRQAQHLDQRWQADMFASR